MEDISERLAQAEADLLALDKELYEHRQAIDGLREMIVALSERECQNYIKLFDEVRLATDDIASLGASFDRNVETTTNSIVGNSNDLARAFEMIGRLYKMIGRPRDD